MHVDEFRPGCTASRSSNTAVADPAIGSIGDIDTALVALRFESVNRDFEERYPLVYVEEMEAAPAPGFREEAGGRPSPFRRWGEVTSCRARRCN